MSNLLSTSPSKTTADFSGHCKSYSYRQTEVGLIPNDWCLDRLGNLGKFKNGVNKSADDFGFGSPFVNLMDVFGKPVVKGNESFGLINSSELDKKEYSLIKGDVLFIRSSVKPSGVGLTTVVLSDLKDTVYSGFLIRFRSNEQLVVEFKKHCFYEEAFRARVISGSTVSANTNINQDTLKEILIAFPSSKEEQTAIANALSDVDALIQELEKLIAKKQAIKTATMQQLLTGRTRLPQFAHHPDGRKKGYKPSELGEIPEDWEVVPMGSVGLFGRGRVISHMEINRSISRQYPVYSSQTSNYGIMGYLDSYDFDGEYITWTTDGVNAGKVFYRSGKFNCTNVCGVISIKSEDAGYIAIAMSLESRKYVSTNLANPKLMNGEAKKVLIKKPNIKDEQIAIASIFRDMDEDIIALEQRLNKTRQIKQGMMQELLTGKTRLVKPAGAA